jgi:hypothetical protein
MSKYPFLNKFFADRHDNKTLMEHYCHYYGITKEEFHRRIEQEDRELEELERGLDVLAEVERRMNAARKRRRKRFLMKWWPKSRSN